MNKDKATIWKCFKEFVNSKSIGSVIMRKEIVAYIEKNGILFYNKNSKIYVGDKSYVSVNTLDYIRNLAEKVGYLSKTRTDGVYVVSRHFPSDYSVSQLRKDYDQGLWH